METGLYANFLGDVITVLKCEGGPWGIEPLYSVVVVWVDGVLKRTLISPNFWKRVS